jgi:hypothetical protein
MASPTRPTVVAQLEREWPLLARRELAVSLACWHDSQPALRRFQRAQDLVTFLHAAAASESDGPLLALLVLAPDEPPAGRIVLQAILPALKAQARRLTNRATTGEELWELLLFHAWEAICTYPLTRRRRVAANLVLQVLHATSRELRRCAHPETAPAPRSSHDSAPCASVGRRAASRPPRAPLLRAAVAAGVIGRRDAALILHTRLRNTDLHLLARRTCVPYDALLKRRQRAEQELRVWARVQANVRNQRAGSLPLVRPPVCP